MTVPSEKIFECKLCFPKGISCYLLVLWLYVKSSPGIPLVSQACALIVYSIPGSKLENVKEVLVVFSFSMLPKPSDLMMDTKNPTAI